VPDVGASLNRFRPKSNGAPIWDLTASITATSIAFASLFLAAQGVPSIPTHRFVCVNLLLNRLVADRQLAGNLLRTPLQAEQKSHLNQDLFINVSHITARLRSLFRQILSLAGTISSTAGSTGHLSTYSRFMAPQNMGNLGLCLPCFHNYTNLITFGLAEVCIGHVLLRLAGQKVLKHKLTLNKKLFVCKLNP
jgi:hypothetical protein